MRKVVSPGQIELDFKNAAKKAREESIRNRIKQTPAAALRPEPFVCAGISTAPTYFDLDGRNYNSRAEARYACFAHYLGLRYEYEPEKYAINGRPMIPDFYLPEHGVFVEVGPSDSEAHSVKVEKARGLADATGCPVLVTFGFIEYRAANRRPLDVTPWAYAGSFVLPAPHTCDPETVNRFFPGLALLRQWNGEAAWDAVDVARNYRFEAARDFKQAA